MSAEHGDRTRFSAWFAEAPDVAAPRSPHALLDAVEARIDAIERPRLHAAEWVALGLFTAVAAILAPSVIAAISDAVGRTLGADAGAMVVAAGAAAVAAALGGILGRGRSRTPPR